MASHRLSETYRQSKQGSSLGYGGKAKTDRGGLPARPDVASEAESGPFNEQDHLICSTTVRASIDSCSL